MIVDCPTCNGAGEVLYMPRHRYSPEDVQSARCGDCKGTGNAEACDTCRELVCECPLIDFEPGIALVLAGFENEGEGLPF